jgi:hypothetical protein
MRLNYLRPSGYRLVLFLVLSISILGLVALRSSARTSAISVTITNNSTGEEIDRIFLSPTDRDKWGPDQLGGSTIAPGGSSTLSNVSCDAANIKVIAEDQNGCFLYQTVACGADSTWSITNDATPDCGN